MDVKWNGGAQWKMMKLKLPIPPLLRRLCRMLIEVMAGCLILAISLLFFFQHRLIYQPQRYEFQLDKLNPSRIRILRFQTGGGRQTAFYLPPKKESSAPRTLWVVFNGNASRALDWVDLFEKTPDPESGFLFIDYPGYGECQGNPTPESILESSEKALATLAAQFHADPRPRAAQLRVFGYSLGAAAALQFAVQHEVERVVLVAPFTSTRAMARRMVGWPLCGLLHHRFDNRARLAELASRPKRPEVVIFHGDADAVVPVAMSRELAALVPGWIQYTEFRGVGHNEILDAAEPQILKALD